MTGERCTMERFNEEKEERERREKERKGAEEKAQATRDWVKEGGSPGRFEMRWAEIRENRIMARVDERARAGREEQRRSARI